MVKDSSYLRMRESERRRQLRINQARERANDLTRVVRQRVQREQFRLVKKIGTEELEKFRSQKLTELSRLQNEYQDALNDFGIGHDGAKEQFKYEKWKELHRHLGKFPFFKIFTFTFLILHDSRMFCFKKCFKNSTLSSVSDSDVIEK